MLIDIVKKCVSSEKLDWGIHKNTFTIELFMTIENETQKFDYTVEQITRKPVQVGLVEQQSFTEQIGSILTWVEKVPQLKQAAKKNNDDTERDVQITNTLSSGE